MRIRRSVRPSLARGAGSRTAGILPPTTNSRVVHQLRFKYAAASGSDKSAALTPVTRFSLERAIEYIAADELVEATPLNLRLRKRILCATERKRSEKRPDYVTS